MSPSTSDWTLCVVLPDLSVLLVLRVPQGMTGPAGPIGSNGTDGTDEFKENVFSEVVDTLKQVHNDLVHAPLWMEKNQLFSETVQRVADTLKLMEKHND